MACDPRLQTLLDVHGISLEAFRKKGRIPTGTPDVFAIRQAIVTALHTQGMSWAEMVQMTGLSIPGIARLTGGKGCPAVVKKRKEWAAAQGRKGKGGKKPDLSARLVKAWENGDFDFHKGRKRPPNEIAKLQAAFTPERRAAMSKETAQRWQNPQYRETLLQFHRSPEQRVLRSEAQAARTRDNPSIRGKCGWATTVKCSKKEVWYRSSYEKAAFDLLDQDPLVCSYDVEPVVRLDTGKVIMPDLVVHYFAGPSKLVEVKAFWVLTQPEQSRVRTRLRLSEEYAALRGWGFEVWTEKDRLKDVVGNRKVKNSSGL
jgi:hypothetical protein